MNQDLEIEEKKVSMRSKQIWQSVYKRGSFEINNLTTFPLELRSRLNNLISLERPKIIKTQNSTDGTIKWLIKLFDGNKVECVFIPEKTRATLCISSQVGCTLNCRFCHTGTQRLVKNLSFAVKDFDVKNSVRFNNPYEFLITSYQEGKPENNTRTKTFLNRYEDALFSRSFEVREDLIPQKILENSDDIISYIEMEDDSMSPEIEPGDKIIFTPITEFNENYMIDFGSLYCIEGGDIRRIVKTGDLKKDTILLMPSNQVKWPSAEVKLKDIELIGKVIGVIKAL